MMPVSSNDESGISANKEDYEETLVPQLEDKNGLQIA
jgi:hypothetical protein